MRKKQIRIFFKKSPVKTALLIKNPQSKSLDCQGIKKTENLINESFIY